MNTPTYNQYCLQSLDASNTFQHSEAMFTEDTARNKAINDFSDISNPTKQMIVNKYLFYRGIKRKRLSSRASTNPAKLLGLFVPVKKNSDIKKDSDDSDIKTIPPMTSVDLCFVYQYKTRDKKTTNVVCKMINKTSSSFFIDNNKINENEDKFDYKNRTYTKINSDGNLIELIDVKTTVQVKLDPLLCLQSALYNDKLKNKEDQIDIFIKGRIFLNCFKYWYLNHKNYANGEIIIHILGMCLNGNKYIKVLNPINFIVVMHNKIRTDKESEISNLEKLLKNFKGYNNVIDGSDDNKNKTGLFEFETLYEFLQKYNTKYKIKTITNEIITVDIDKITEYINQCYEPDVTTSTA